MEKRGEKAGNYDRHSIDKYDGKNDTDLHRVVPSHLNSSPGMGKQVCKEEECSSEDGIPFSECYGTHKDSQAKEWHGSGRD